ncbi:hypothetical protein EVAR_24488_1 [Eumeta japonica]|uniref:Uncharacterized protein n=1 Tax=Eumeta variegata TaxID=151549 RepID=A0A4C1WXB0_EUMVA|nr:hypothetical protein EVAR_24488_1 [Eumeta japonica]
MGAVVHVTFKSKIRTGPLGGGHTSNSVTDGTWVDNGLATPLGLRVSMGGSDRLLSGNSLVSLLHKKQKGQTRRAVKHAAEDRVWLRFKFPIR